MGSPSPRRPAAPPVHAFPPALPGRRALTGLLVALAVVVMSAAGTAAPLHAQAADPTTTAVESDGQSPAGNILPRPGSGQAPDSPNDPGGWMQYAVFGVILAGIAIIVLLVVRESRKARGNRTSTGTGRTA
jgi:hypothetical protein